MDFELQLRPAVVADVVPHYEIYRAAMREYEVAAHGSWDEDRRWDDFRRHFPVGRAQIILADGEAVGAIDAQRRNDAWWLNNIEIDPAWQGRGIGTELIARLIATAHAQALPVALQVLKVNTRASAFYERLGFAVVGETSTHWEMRVSPDVSQ